ncbi:uncharacterized protein LOC135470297 [Liolophura sinensis]|uniref:uncharacterized protein LOC135470297 n=1 Tax=Liolophura sinensis TaxID=3198878 RepID=UPI0031580815
MFQNVAHDIKTKTRTGDVLIAENVDFAGLLLSDTVLAGLSGSGFKKPSPIQLKAIPIGRCGLDLIVQAKSGTGKTVVFTTIALESLQLESNSTQVLVMAPTREIAVQIWEVMKSISSEMIGIQCRMFIGGLPVNQDKQKLKHCHVAIGTPGRIKQLIENDMLKTESIRLFILDEADKLLEESFQEQINWIYSMLPDNKQMLALSATYPEYMAQQLTVYMRNPTFVRLNSEDPALLGIKQYFETAPFHPFPHTVFENKVKVLVKILSSVSFHQCLVFSNLQARAQSLCDILNSKGWPSVCIAGCLEQEKRLQAMEKLKTFKCRVLISTDLTSRGIDAENVNLVVNLDLPHDHETYLHRIGRAGRFGSFGASIILISGAEERDRLKTVEAKCNTCIHRLPDPIPADLADTDVPVSLGELVTATKIITRPEENVSRPTAEACEESTSGDFSLAGNNNTCNLPPVDSSCASKKLPERSSDTAGYVEKSDLREKSVNDSLNSLAEAETPVVDIQPQVDVVSKTEEGNVDYEGQFPTCHYETGAMQEHPAISEACLLSEEGSSVEVVSKDFPETNGSLMNTDVHTNHNNVRGITISKEEPAGSLTEAFMETEQLDVGKESNTSKKKGRKKKKTNNTILQEEFGGGECFQIFNTDMVILERPEPCKARSHLPPPPVIRDFKAIHTSKSNIGSSTHETMPGKSNPSLTLKQPVSSELPLSSSCSMNTDNPKPFPSKDVWTGTNAPFKFDVHGRKKIVAVRRRRFGIATNSYQKHENNDCNVNYGNSHENNTLDKICITDGRDHGVSVKPEKKSVNANSSMTATQAATEDQSTKPINGDLKSHTYSNALENYENFLQTWDETSEIADVGDWITLLMQKCKASRSGRSNGISREMVSKTLNDVKPSHINDLNDSQRNVENNSSDNLSKELRTLSLKDDLPHIATCNPTSIQSDQVSSRSEVTDDSENAPKFHTKVGSGQQLKGKTGINSISLDSLSQISSSTMLKQISSHPEAIASLNGTKLQQAPIDSKTQGGYLGTTSKTTKPKIAKDSSDQAIKWQISQKHSTKFTHDKSTSGNSSSSIFSDTSSSSESSYDSGSESDCDSDGESEESPGNYYSNYGDKKSCDERYSGKNTFQDETEESLKCDGHGYNFKNHQEQPKYSHHTQYVGYDHTSVPHGNPESVHHYPMPHWYHNQYYYPCAPPYPPHWSYPPWYAHYPYPYPYHLPPNTYYPQSHKNPRINTMNNFLNGDLEETDCHKMKKILKCQFDYLKYMKKP